MKKVLVLGATGAMGQYLTPRLAEMGYLVDGVALDAAISVHKNLKYIQANTKAEGVLDALLTFSQFALYQPAGCEKKPSPTLLVSSFILQSLLL